jgi:hypothetical protein
MKLEIYSYRYAREILQHPDNQPIWDEIIGIVTRSPLFVRSAKSKKNDKLDVVQQCLNTWFDRAFAVEAGWAYHPLATGIEKSQLAADFRKTFNAGADSEITIQAEVQFGNMSRWYSDVFKFQTAYSQSLIKMALSIVPMRALATRIDSNVVSYERVLRELPAAELSITLPILVIGVEPDDDTDVVDLSKSKISAKQLGGNSRIGELNRFRIVNALFSGKSPYGVTTKSDTGEIPVSVSSI